MVESLNPSEGLHAKEVPPLADKLVLNPEQSIAGAEMETNGSGSIAIVTEPLPEQLFASETLTV